MIYTLTMNPSMDCLAAAADYTKGQINAIGAQALYPCGKGINVSVLLNRLGVPSTALGLCAGFTGREIAQLLEEEGIQTDFVFLSKGCSRINFKLRTSSGETEFNGCGPQVGEEDLAALFQKLSCLQTGDFLVLSGSVPPGCPKDFYRDVLKHLAGKSINCIVDSGDLLPVLPYRPFLVKPNQLELAAMLGTSIQTVAQAAAGARRLLQEGARQVLVSMGEQGAVFVSEEATLYASALAGDTVSPCGAGDSMVAGFLYGLPQGIREALSWGTAAGAATAFSEGIATARLVNICYEKINGLFA